METLIALIGAGFTPYIATNYLPSTGLLNDAIMPFVMMFAVLLVVTWVTSIIRSLRYCKDKKSYGVWSGLKKGLILGSICSVLLYLVKVMPFFQAPLKLVPFAGSYLDSGVLVLTYMVFYLSLIYPIYGSC